MDNANHLEEHASTQSSHSWKRNPTFIRFRGRKILLVVPMTSPASGPTTSGTKTSLSSMPDISD